MRHLFTAALLVSLGCAPRFDPERPRGSGEAAAQSQEIQWRPWGAEAFAEAKATGKMVLVDVGIEGCTTCRWMDEQTHADPEIATLVATYFVPISVDADA